MTSKSKAGEPSGALDKLPRMTFTARPAPSAAASERRDVAYNINSARALVEALGVREGGLPRKSS